MQKLFTYSSEKREYALTARPEISRIQRPFSMGFSGDEPHMTLVTEKRACQKRLCLTKYK